MHRVHDKTLSKAERRQLWDEIIKDYLACGKTMQAYSQKHELNYDHLSYYVRSYQHKIQSPVQFVPVATIPLTQEQKLTIHYGDVILDIPLSIPVNLICQIIQGLKSC